MQPRVNFHRGWADLLVIAVAVIAALVYPHVKPCGPGECLIRTEGRVAVTGYVAATGLTVVAQPAGQVRGTAGDQGGFVQVAQPLPHVPIDVLVSSRIDELDAASQESKSKVVGYGSPPALTEIGNSG
ncbi:MAG: hypothetical protein WCO57_13950 [Verrucomicrobiota bacterium]